MFPFMYLVLCSLLEAKANLAENDYKAYESVKPYLKQCKDNTHFSLMTGILVRKCRTECTLVVNLCGSLIVIVPFLHVASGRLRP